MIKLNNGGTGKYWCFYIFWFEGGSAPALVFDVIGIQLVLTRCHLYLKRIFLKYVFLRQEGFNLFHCALYSSMTSFILHFIFSPVLEKLTITDNKTAR